MPIHVTEKHIAAALGLVAASTALVLLGGVRGDIAGVERTVRAQHDLIARQEELLERQTSLSAMLVELTEALRGKAVEAAETSESIETRTRRLITLTEQLLEEVREMNRRTGGGVSSGDPVDG